MTPEHTCSDSFYIEHLGSEHENIINLNMYVVTTSVIEWHIAPAFEYKPFTYLAIIWHCFSRTITN